jgi:hypothetical protein
MHNLFGKCRTAAASPGLLARALIDADQELMREFGDRVAECTAAKAKA